MALITELDHVGFTGSRQGMTTYQLDMFAKFLERRRSLKGPGWFHHGICVGADAQAHKIAKAMGYLIHGHPPVNTVNMADLPQEDFGRYDSTFSYSGRNQRIAIACKILFAAPRAKSVGTNNCINHANNLKRPHVVCFANQTKQYFVQPGDL